MSEELANNHLQTIDGHSLVHNTSFAFNFNQLLSGDYRWTGRSGVPGLGVICVPKYWTNSINQHFMSGEMLIKMTQILFQTLFFRSV